MRRQIYEKLKTWKTDPDRKPLILRGARQVGKTWVIKEFGRLEFSSMAYLNCEKNESAKTLFQEDFDVHRLIRGISALTKVDIKPKETLIVLDEIQEVPRAIQSLKYFCEDAPEYFVCAAGSLLGLKLRGEASFPVGKVDELNMYPLNFEEFVLASDGEISYQMLQKSGLEELSAISSKWKELLRQYYFTGGMPEVVKAYIDGKGLERVRRIQKTILSNYDDDISKHAVPRTAIRIHQVWMSMAQQLSKENKKFVYAHIQKGARAKDYETAITWLIDAGLIYRIPCVTKPCIPLKFYEDVESFKLYYLDCGLMGALSDAPADQILIGDNIFVEYKGAFTEQYVLQQMLTKHSGSFLYYHPDNSDQEVDFMTQNGSLVYAIDVKAEENLKAKSLRLMKNEYPETIAFRASMSNFKRQDWVTNIPLYAVCRMFDL